jgi:hypothetical protein
MRAKYYTAPFVALALAAVPLLARAETSLTVGKSIASASVMLPANLGVEFGIFKKRGIDVKVCGLHRFRTHTIDADIFSTAEIFAMEEKHEGRLLADVADFTGNIAAGMIFATKDAIRHALGERKRDD